MELPEHIDTTESGVLYVSYVESNSIGATGELVVAVTQPSVKPEDENEDEENDGEVMYGQGVELWNDGQTAFLRLDVSVQ